MVYRKKTSGRGKGKTYPVTSTESQVTKFIKAGTPEYIAMTTIEKFDYAGPVNVEDGDGSRYTVTMQDGSVHDVEISDVFDGGNNYDIDEEDAGDEEWGNVQVVWDGAVDFSEDYDRNSTVSVAEVRQSLIDRYGAIARDYLGVA
jgi:hypothetical protein